MRPELPGVDGRQMNLLYVANSIIPSQTANSVHVMRMCAAFARNGHKVDLAVPARAERNRAIEDLYGYYGVPPAFTIHILPWLPFTGRAFPFAIASARLAGRLQAQLVYSRMAYACYFAVRRGLPTVFESHAPVEELDEAGQWMFRRMIHRSEFRGLVVISNALREIYEEQFPQLVGRIRVAPDGADELPVGDESGSSARSDSDRLQVGYTGHLYPGRGMDLIAKVAERCPWADFHMIGGMRKDVEHWRKACQGMSNLTFHGFCPPAQVQERVRSMDVLLAPYARAVAVFGGKRDSSRWMSPLKIFEYMAAGKPMVASDLPVLREILNPDNAVLVEPGDVDAWVNALMRLRDPQLRERVATRAHRDFLASYTWTRRAQRVLA